MREEHKQWLMEKLLLPLNLRYSKGMTLLEPQKLPEGWGVFNVFYLWPSLHSVPGKERNFFFFFFF